MEYLGGSDIGIWFREDGIMIISGAVSSLATACTELGVNVAGMYDGGGS